MSPRSFWLCLFAFSVVVFGMTNHVGHVRVNDTDAANVPAWWFVHHGTFFLDRFKSLTHSNNPWFIKAGPHIVSNRTAGIVLFGLPMQGLFAGLTVSANAVGSMTALLASAVSVANVGLLLRRLGNPSLAACCALVFATATGVWTVASAELWPHSADLFWISCGLLALQNGRTVAAGLLLAPLVATRPHLALVVATLGLWLATKRRSPRMLVHFGVPSAAVVGGLFLWNDFIYGRPSLTGGYSGMVDELPGHGSVLWRMVINTAGAIASPLRGVLLYSPVVLIFVICVLKGWRRSPDWARAAVVGGIFYELVQLRLNRYSGGIGFYSNRLVLEPLILGCPVAYLGLLEWRKQTGARQTIIRALATASIAIHGVGAFCTTSYMLHPQSWMTWGPVAAVRYETGPAIAIIVVAVIAGTVVTVWPLRRGAAAAAEPVQPLATAGAATPG